MDRFGSYTVLERLGAGGMASVHRATIEIGGGVIREVALKRMLPQLADDKELLDDFIREAKLAAHLQHPNIVRILELGRNGATYFIAMELVRGSSLLQLMKHMSTRKETAPIGIVIALLDELCEALDYASSATDDEGEPLEIVHRDLSPSNLIVDTDGHLKVIDFGVAKSTRGQFMTNSGMIKGKLGYTALEVLVGKPVDRRADIFSVGVVAWELLTGRRLFVAATEHDVITKIRRGATVPPSKLNADVSPELDEIVMHALSRKRDERWPSAGVMKRALDSLRRTHRDGPHEVSAWRRSLIPAPPSNTRTSSIKQAAVAHYLPEIDDSPTEMTVAPPAAHLAIASERHQAEAAQRAPGAAVDAPSHSLRQSIVAPGDAAPVRDTIPAEEALSAHDTLSSEEAISSHEDD